jgi:hypothetical protein
LGGEELGGRNDFEIGKNGDFGPSNASYLVEPRHAFLLGFLAAC